MFIASLALLTQIFLGCAATPENPVVDNASTNNADKIVCYVKINGQLSSSYVTQDACENLKLTANQTPETPMADAKSTKAPAKLSSVSELPDTVDIQEQVYCKTDTNGIEAYTHISKTECANLDGTVTREKKNNSNIRNVDKICLSKPMVTVKAASAE